MKTRLSKPTISDGQENQTACPPPGAVRACAGVNVQRRKCRTCNREFLPGRFDDQHNCRLCVTNAWLEESQ